MTGISGYFKDVRPGKGLRFAFCGRYEEFWEVYVRPKVAILYKRSPDLRHSK